MVTDVLFAEIGSTTTVVSAFSGLTKASPCLIGQGLAETTVLLGDVTIGLDKAREDLRRKLGVKELKGNRFFASSSAAGGLKMSVHGLVYDMTVKAAREAALGAGANLGQVTAGILTQNDLEELKVSPPNIILIAGGVDYGEKETALQNAQMIARLELNIPVIYAGNIQNRQEVAGFFQNSRSPLYQVENVYPGIDRLEVEPARRIIQKVFEEHITRAPGMEKIRELVDAAILPTPGAVLTASILLQQELGDLITLDVGGATTDIHSVVEGFNTNGPLQLSPEPAAKRTVEGDLGVYENRIHILSQTGSILPEKFPGNQENPLAEIVTRLPPIPRSEKEREIVKELAFSALSTALNRHAGRYRQSFSPGGKTELEGRDLTGITYVIGTGGVLTCLEGGKTLIQRLFSSPHGKALLPETVPEILIDRSYIMAAAGVISREYPQAAVKLLQESLGYGRS